MHNDQITNQRTGLNRVERLTEMKIIEMVKQYGILRENLVLAGELELRTRYKSLKQKSDQLLVDIEKEIEELENNQLE